MRAQLAAGLALVALAGASSALFGSRAGPTDAPSPLVGRLAFDVAVGVLLTYVAVATVLGVWAVVTGRGGMPRVARQRRTVRELVVFVLVLAAVVAAASRLQPIDATQDAGDGVDGDRPPASSASDGDGPTTPATDFAVIGGVAFLLLGGLAYALLRSRPKRVPSTVVGETSVAAAAAAAVVDLRAEADPRRAVVAAYLRMDAALADHDLGRRPAETPFEHLGRVLDDAGIPADASRRLVELFERARFSSHPVDVSMRAEALAHLEAVRDHLAPTSGRP